MTPVNVQTDYPTAELTRARCRQAIGSVSLLLVVALALSTTVRVGRPALVDSGRDGEQGRAVAVTVHTV